MVLMKEMGIKNILTGDQHFFQVGMEFLRVPDIKKEFQDSVNYPDQE